MRGYLLDTHVLLRWLAKPRQLPAHVRQLLADRQQPVWLSVAAVWEMAVKHALGSLSIPDDLTGVLAEESIGLLDIQASHALATISLPMLHRDPFDRLQIAQAKSMSLTLITHDRQILQYPDVSLLAL